MTKFIGKALHMESNLITLTRKLYLALQTKGKHTAARKQAVPEDEIFYAYDKTKKNESGFKSQTTINTKDMFVCSRHKTDNTSKWLQRQQGRSELHLHLFARKSQGNKTQHRTV